MNSPYRQHHDGLLTDCESLVKSSHISRVLALPAAGNARTTISPADSEGRCFRNHSRHARFTLLRTTALPTAVLTTRPSRGSPSVTNHDTDKRRLRTRRPCFKTLVNSFRDSKTFTTTLTTVGNNTAATRSFHARTKPVFTCSAAFAWLVCTFHKNLVCFNCLRGVGVRLEKVVCQGLFFSGGYSRSCEGSKKKVAPQRFCGVLAIHFFDNRELFGIYRFGGQRPWGTCGETFARSETLDIIDDPLASRKITALSPSIT
jgi:hypothetical protein